MMLLDTNVFYWWLNDPDRLSPTARDTITSSVDPIVVSAVVPWELAIKTNLGRIDGEAVLSIWDEKLATEDFTELPIESAHAIRAGSLPLHHRDPFDRLLAAQAQVTGWAIISADRIFDYYGVRRIW